MPLSVKQKTDIRCILCMQISMQDKINNIQRSLNINISCAMKVKLERAMSQSAKIVFDVLEGGESNHSQKANIIPLSRNTSFRTRSMDGFDDCDRDPKDDDGDYVLVRSLQNTR